MPLSQSCYKPSSPSWLCLIPSGGGSPAFPTGKTQQVKLEKQMLDTLDPSSGLPHGCVLSPVLFSFYISGCTSKDLSVKLLKFADSTTVQLFTLPYSWWWQVSVQTWGGTAGCLVHPKQPGAKSCKNCKDEGRLHEETPPPPPPYTLPSSCASHQCQPFYNEYCSLIQAPGSHCSFKICEELQQLHPD